MSNIRITIAQDASQIATLEERWEQLYRLSPTATMFQSFAWNLLAARIFSGREQPYLVCAESSTGAAIIPACRVPGFGLKFLGEQLFDYPGVLHCGEKAALHQVWQELAKLELPLRLHGLRENQPVELPGLTPEPFSGAPFVAAGTSSDKFATEHTRSARLLRRLESMGCRVRRASGDRRLVHAVYSAKAQQNPGNLFCDEQRRAFMAAVAEDNSAPCEIFLLEQESIMAAAIVSFRDRNVRRFYTTYYDSAWARHSPGAALLYEATRLSLQEGLECDYMTGEQPYKMRLASGTVPLFRIDSQLSTGANVLGRSLLAA